MGDSPSLVSFFLNCVYILHHNDQINVSFASSSIVRKTTVDILYGSPQWDIPQAWFLSYSTTSTYYTTMTKLMFPFLSPQLQENNGGDVIRCSSMGNFPSLVSFLLNCVYILHHNDQVNFVFAGSLIARKIMVEMLYGPPQWEIT